MLWGQNDAVFIEKMDELMPDILAVRFETAILQVDLLCSKDKTLQYVLVYSSTAFIQGY